MLQLGVDDGTPLRVEATLLPAAEDRDAVATAGAMTAVWEQRSGEEPPELDAQMTDALTALEEAATWVHTDTIRRLGAAEEVLNTPSHRRVHHGTNPQYIDRNHGSILIVWDRLFATFEREREPVVYGLTKNIDTFNPVRIAGHEYADIVRDVAASDNWVDRPSFVLRGPGWAYRRHAEQAAARDGARGAEPAELVGAGVA